MFPLYLVIVLLVFGMVIWLIIKQDKQQKGETSQKDAIIENLQKQNENLKQEISFILNKPEAESEEQKELSRQLQQKATELEKIEKLLKDEQKLKDEAISRLNKQLEFTKSETAKLKEEGLADLQHPEIKKEEKTISEKLFEVKPATQQPAKPNLAKSEENNLPEGQTQS